MKEDSFHGKGTHKVEPPQATVASAMKNLYPSFFKENEN